MGDRPVPAVRRTTAAPSTGLLINVIRSLTSTISDDQRELEKARLEKGFKESEARIDTLVRNHQQDIEETIDCFRDVSLRISNCRERIHNVRNALQTCKTLLECRRDDLRKLWLENAQQRYICEILAQLEEVRDAPMRVDLAISAQNYEEAARIVNSSRDLVDGRLSNVEGLNHFRQTIQQTSRHLADLISDQLVSILVVEPFEQHMREVVRTLPEQRIQESEQCKSLMAKAIPPSETLELRLSTLLSALRLLNNQGVKSDIERIMALSGAQIEKQIAATVALIKTRATMDGLQEGDQSHLIHLMKMALESSKTAHMMLADSKEGAESKVNVIAVFWDGAQGAVEAFVADHLDITPLVKEPIETKKQLFRFDHTAFAGSTSSGSSAQSVLVVCPPSANNMVSMFSWLRLLMESIEKATGEQNCRLRRFVHSFVMEMFVERVKASLSERLDAALSSGDAARVARLQNTRVLPSCERVFELCKEVHSLIVKMDLYADRFAALLLLLLTEYNKSVIEMYEKTALSLCEVDGVSSRRKISANWAADEDISRLLMSLPNWQRQLTSSSNQTPSTPAVESEHEVRQRNERESEILMGNLGMQKKIDRTELVTDLGDVRALASLHESLRWFASEVRSLISQLPAHIREMLLSCVVQVRSRDGQLSENAHVLKAMEEIVRRLENISDTCLLMLHLELRVHCFFHLLPLARTKHTNVHDETDPEVLDLGKDLQQFYQLLSEILSRPKLHYIFDGLGHLCASIFIHMSQHMGRLSDPAKKRLSRDVWGVQQRLSQITDRREAALDRARLFFDLLLHETDRLLTILPEHRVHFNITEIGHLVALSVRSDPLLASQPGALEARMAQLPAIFRQTTRE